MDFTGQKGRTHYKYATLANITDTVNPFLGACGLSATFRTSQEGNNITVTCVLAHSSGHSEQTSLTAGADVSGNKNSIQAVGSTISYLQKYTFLAITGLATSEQDDDGKGATATAVKGNQPHQPANNNAASTPNTDDTDKRGASYWIIQADKAAKTATSLSRWFSAITPEAKKIMPTDQWKKLESYVTQLLDSLDGTSPEEKKALAGWLAYLRTITDVDVLTVTWEEKVFPMLKNFMPENQEKLENCRREVANKIMEGK